VAQTGAANNPKEFRREFRQIILPEKSGGRFADLGKGSRQHYIGM